MPLPRVFVVEDNPTDYQVLCWALEETSCPVDLKLFEDGDLVLAFLREAAAEDLPDLIILDLNLKRVDGTEVLAYIRQTERLRQLKVVILSSSPQKIMQNRANGADAYFQKAMDLDNCVANAKAICDGFLDTPRRTNKSSQDESQGL